MSHLAYPAIIRPLSTEEGGGYLIEFPDLPGCMANGETVEEAIAQSQDAVVSWLATAHAFKDSSPKPYTQHYSGQWRLRLPKSLHAALALYAEHEGVSLNTLAIALLAEGIGKKANKTV